MIGDRIVAHCGGGGTLAVLELEVDGVATTAATLAARFGARRSRSGLTELVPMTETPTSRRGLTKHRIEALADGIFAVAMTLLVLDIKLPDSIAYASDGDLWHAARRPRARISRSTSISFIVLAMYWVGHHFQFHFIVRYVDRTLLWINLYLLLLRQPACRSRPTSSATTYACASRRCSTALNLLLVAAAFCVAGRHICAGIRISRSRSSRRRRSSLLQPARSRCSSIVPVLSMVVVFYSPRLALYLYLSLPLVRAALPPRPHRRRAARCAERAITNASS